MPEDWLKRHAHTPEAHTPTPTQHPPFLPHTPHPSERAFVLAPPGRPLLTSVIVSVLSAPGVPQAPGHTLAPPPTNLRRLLLQIFNAASFKSSMPPPSNLQRYLPQPLNATPCTARPIAVERGDGHVPRAGRAARAGPWRLPPGAFSRRPAVAAGADWCAVCRPAAAVGARAAAWLARDRGAHKQPAAGDGGATAAV
eukprot:365189-Chlamydomonas_euryale.AAC.7